MDQYHWDIGKRCWMVKQSGEDTFRQSIWLIGCDSFSGKRKIEKYIQDHPDKWSSKMEIV